MIDLPPGLFKDEKSGNFRIGLRCCGTRLHKSLKTRDAKKALTILATIRETAHDLERGRIELPPGTDLWEFLKTGGRRNQKFEAPETTTLEDLFKWYFDQLPDNSKESNTLKTERIHVKHLLRILGPRKQTSLLTGADLQGYVNSRAREKRFGRAISRKTIEKELATFRMVWGLAINHGKMKNGKPIGKDVKLIFPKGKEKPPFQTWDEIEKTIARGGLTEKEKRELWDCLFLSREQVAELLEFTREKKTRTDYFFPLMVFVAHTGARLSEVMRARVEDFKLDDMEVLLREKKRDKTKTTFRRVPMSKLLAQTMREFFKIKPEGVYAICREPHEPMKESTLHEAFEWFFRNSKWQVLRGYHIFRHSLASNMALEGIDQRVIDEILGHQTEEMRKRYRHLFPKQRQSPIQQLFD